jgi:hypothetical protein
VCARGGGTWQGWTVVCAEGGRRGEGTADNLKRVDRVGFCFTCGGGAGREEGRWGGRDDSGWLIWGVRGAGCKEGWTAASGRGWAE